RQGRGGADVAGGHGGGAGPGAQAPRRLAAELGFAGAVDADLEAGLARVVGEQRDADGPCALGDGRARAAQMVAAGGEREDGEECRASHTIRLSIRPGTKTTLRTSRPPACVWMCGSASAAATTWASP